MANNSMIRMTTPDIIFDVDVDLTEALEISMTFRQLAKNVLVLDKSKLNVTPTTITHTFTQEESGMFFVGPMDIQIKALTSDGRVISHDPVRTSASVIFDERYFTDGTL